MALTAKSITDKASDILGDPDKIKWTEAELRTYLSEGQRAAVLLKPEVNPVTTNLTLERGSKQSIPDDGYVLIEVTRNMGDPDDDPAVPGRVVTPTSREAQDQADPTWHEIEASPVAAATSITNYIYDIRNRKTFFVVPPHNSQTAHRIEIVYAKTPTPVGADDLSDPVNPVLATLGVDDIYEPALLSYVLHRALGKTLDETGDMDRSAVYLQMFNNILLGQAEQNEADLTIRHETVEGMK